MSAGLDKLATILITPGKDAAILRLEPGLSRAELTPEALCAMLDAMGLVRHAERDRAVRGAVKTYFDHRHEGLELPILQGVAAAHGIDGHLDLTPEVLESLGGLGEQVLDADGNVQHRARSSLAMVKAGTKLGRLIEPIAGCDGTDVHGHVLAARDGRAFELEPDDSIVVGGDGWIVATRDGVVEHHGRVLRVSQKLVLGGGIDFSTGNIDFPGDVRVEGAIADCFVVKVGGNLHVRDLVDAATLEVAGSIVLESGMAGRGFGSVRAGKDVFATYLTSVRGAIARDTAFETELADCELRIGRHLNAPRGTVLRGDVCVGHASEVGCVGNEAGVPTTLRLGWMHEARELAKRLQSLSAQAQRSTQEASWTLGAMSASAKRLHAEDVTRMHLDKSMGMAHLERMTKAYQMLTRLRREHTATRLVVHEAIHAGTELHLESWGGAWVVRVHRMLRGPMEITLSASGEPVVLWRATHRTTPLREWALVSRSEESVDMDALGRAIAAACEVVRMPPPARSA
jgi:uncharacterized protein